MSKNWFDVDKKGLAQLLERRGQSFIVTELIQNAWDEDVTNVEVSFAKRTTDKKWVVSITDDAPEGFADLADAFTLFKASKKKGDANKRGRFNLGEKLVLALASEASIISTKGTVAFDSDGRKRSSHKRPSGTCFQAVFPSLKNADVDEALASKEQAMKKHDELVVAFLFKHTPEEFVRFNSHDEVDWQYVIDNAGRFSGGERAVLTLVAFLLDRPGVLAEFTVGWGQPTLPGLLGAMDVPTRADAVQCVALWATSEKAGA